MSLIYNYYEDGVPLKNCTGKPKMVYLCKICKKKDPSNTNDDYGKYRCDKGIIHNQTSKIS